MKTHIIRIGNSQGIRIPKPFLKQAGLDGEVDIQVKDGSLVVCRGGRPRAGWAAAFRQMAQRGDDVLLDESLPATSWEKEWEW